VRIAHYPCDNLQASRDLGLHPISFHSIFDFGKRSARFHALRSWVCCPDLLNWCRLEFRPSLALGRVRGCGWRIFD
jgi:hypothetical protein